VAVDAVAGAAAAAGVAEEGVAVDSVDSAVVADSGVEVVDLAGSEDRNN
jgi:hypothetical protein